MVLRGNRSADIFSDGISKSLRSGERQPYLYWRSRGRDVRQKTYGRRAVGRVYSRLRRAWIQVRPDRRRQDYPLETTDKAALATLDKQAGKTATVSGSVDGDTIQVSSVVAK